MIPVSNIGDVGLRHLSSKTLLKKLFKILKGAGGETDTDWKKRHKHNLQNMKVGSLVAVGQVLKNLHSLSGRKSLGLRDQKMLDQARKFVASEIAAVQGITGEEALQQLEPGHVLGKDVSI